MNTPMPIDPTQVQVGGPTVSAATAQGFPAIAGYEILSELGRGGMGVVYEARHLKLDRIIALKLMRGDDPLNKARFLAEGQVIAAVKHPHVVEVYDFGESSIGPYIAMEYLTGGTFGDLLKTGLAPRVAAEQIAKIAAGVGAAHNLGIVHRDLKPGNVLLDHLGSPKVTDFGLAKRSTSDLTMTQDAAGTPAYMAPEQARAMKFVGPPADVWSLGVMLYESLTGKRPFTAETDVQLLATIQNDNPPTLRTISKAIPQDLETICLKCLEKEPERRYASANELASDLQAWHEGKPIAAKRAKAIERAMLWVRRKPTVAAAWTLALLVLMLGAFGITTTKLWREAVEEKGEADTARHRAETAEVAAVKAKEDIADERERLAYARSIFLAQQSYESNKFSRSKSFLAQCPEKLRSWDWNYIHRLCHADILTLKGHGNGMTSVFNHEGLTSAWMNHDGSRIVTASNDCTAKVWDSQTGKEISKLTGHKDVVTSAKFNRAGTKVVTASWDGKVKIWDAKSGQELHTLIDHADIVFSAEFNQDDSRIISASNDGTARVWDSQTGKQMFELKGTLWEGKPKKLITALFSPDGEKILTVEKGRMRLWNTRTQIELIAFETDDIVYGTSSAQFSPDGSKVVTTSSEGTQVWDVKTAKVVQSLSDVQDKAVFAAFKPDGTLLVTSTRSGIIKVWDVKTVKLLLTFRGHDGIACSATFSPDGTKVLSASLDGTAKLWGDDSDPDPMLLEGHTGEITSASFNHDGTRVVTTGLHLDATASIWDTASGKRLLVIKGHGAGLWGAAFSPDGATLATASKDGLAKLWDSKTGALMHTLKGHEDEVNFVAYSPDGQRVVTASHDRTAKVWDARDGKELITFKSNYMGVTHAAFSPDGLHLVTGHRDKVAVIWDAITGGSLHTLRGHTEDIWSVAYSPDGKCIASASDDRSTVVWNTETGNQMYRLNGHSKGVKSVRFSPDGLRILTASDDQTAKIWDAKLGFEILTLEGHSDSVSSASFSPDGTRIVTGSHDKTARIYDATPINREFLPKAAK